MYEKPAKKSLTDRFSHNLLKTGNVSVAPKMAVNESFQVGCFPVERTYINIYMTLALHPDFQIRTKTVISPLGYRQSLDATNHMKLSQ